VFHSVLQCVIRLLHSVTHQTLCENALHTCRGISNTRRRSRRTMGWLQSVGSIKSQVSFAEYRLFCRALLQKRPIILSILLTKATPYTTEGDTPRTFADTHIHTLTHTLIHTHRWSQHGQQRCATMHTCSTPTAVCQRPAKSSFARAKPTPTTPGCAKTSTSSANLSPLSEFERGDLSESLLSFQEGEGSPLSKGERGGKLALSDSSYSEAEGEERGERKKEKEKRCQGPNSPEIIGGCRRARREGRIDAQGCPL